MRRYTLRSFLIFIAITCALLAYFTNRVRSQQQAVAAFCDGQRGTVYYDFQMEGRHNVDSDTSSHMPSRLLKITGNDFFHDVTRVDLFADSKDIEIGHFQSLPQVRAAVLILSDAKITRSDLEKIATFSELEALCLNGDVERGALEPLVALTKLRKLHFESQGITELDFKSFQKLRNLRSLSLVDKSRNLNADVDLAELKKAMPNCRISCL